MGMQLVVQSNLIPALRRGLAGALSQVIRKTAFDIEAWAKQDAPVDTGALRASIYVAIAGGGGFASALAAAEARVADARAAGKTPKGRSVGAGNPLLEEITATDDLTAFVVVGAEYGAAVESKQPFLLPALERARAGFEQAVQRALSLAG